MQSFLKHEINFILFAAARVEKGKPWSLKEPCPDPTMMAGGQRDGCPDIPRQQFPCQERQRYSKQSGPSAPGGCEILRPACIPMPRESAVVTDVLFGQKGGLE